jgi:hypothetical protein
MLSCREESFCYYACSQDDPVMVVQDAAQDERFKSVPTVVEAPHIRFYAGAPLITPAGYKLGTLCVIDQKPSAINEEQSKALAQLAQQVVAQMELRLNMQLLQKKTEVLERTNEEKNKFIGVISHDIRQPLQNIMICSELMLQDDECSIPEVYLDSLQTTHSSAKLMHNMYVILRI